VDSQNGNRHARHVSPAYPVRNQRFGASPPPKPDGKLDGASRSGHEGRAVVCGLHHHIADLKLRFRKV